jgi:hypothetical protein
MGHSDNHHIEMEKPVAFYAPLISGLIVIIIILIIIGFFDPSPLHHSEHGQPVKQEATSSSSHSAGSESHH